MSKYSPFRIETLEALLAFIDNEPVGVDDFRRDILAIMNGNALGQVLSYSGHYELIVMKTGLLIPVLADSLYDTVLHVEPSNIAHHDDYGRYYLRKGSDNAHISWFYRDVRFRQCAQENGVSGAKAWVDDFLSTYIVKHKDLSLSLNVDTVPPDEHGRQSIIIEEESGLIVLSYGINEVQVGFVPYLTSNLLQYDIENDVIKSYF